MKADLTSRLQRIRTFEKLKLPDFKDLISKEEMAICKKEKEKNPRWYLLTIDVFVAFLYKV